MKETAFFSLCTACFALIPIGCSSHSEITAPGSPPAKLSQGTQNPQRSHTKSSQGMVTMLEDGALSFDFSNAYSFSPHSRAEDKRFIILPSNAHYHIYMNHVGTIAKGKTKHIISW